MRTLYIYPGLSAHSAALADKTIARFDRPRVKDFAARPVRFTHRRVFGFRTDPDAQGVNVLCVMRACANPRTICCRTFAGVA